MSILVVENLSHSFGGRVIFEDVSFRLNRGEHVGLVGANGEGKSTFMNILTKKTGTRRRKSTLEQACQCWLPGSAYGFRSSKNDS
jgi:ATPase subunit of ABC transporter with duplicated ATPase domains